jgi:hypothetical protein
MAKTVLITGASGLIGKPLTKLLLDKGYSVHQLTRNTSKAIEGAKVFKWDVSRMSIDEKCIENVEAVINLAGEGIAEKAWTRKRKKQLVKSRTDSLLLINDLLKRKPSHQIKTFISLSAVGHYGDRKDETLTEDSEPGTDFLANTCLAWERAADKFVNSGFRVAILRTGMVLSSDGGALPKLAKPITLGLGAALGSGKQWMPWIHIEDTIQLITYVLENDSVKGIFNMTAPFPVTNKEFTRALARQLQKPLWLPRVPEIALRILLGEMSRVALNSTKTTSDKIIESGYMFKYPKLEQALENIYGKDSA